MRARIRWKIVAPVLAGIAMLLALSLEITPARSDQALSATMLDNYQKLRADAGDIINNEVPATTCADVECCMKQAQFFRERISPWYDRKSDLQGSIRDAE